MIWIMPVAKYSVKVKMEVPGKKSIFQSGGY